MTADFWLDAGDLVPSITATLEDADGNAIDITDADVVFVMRLIDADGPTVEAAADNLQTNPATQGMVRYDWVTGDTDVAGGYDAEWRVTFADGIGTMPNNRYVAVAIRDNLGSGS